MTTVLEERPVHAEGIFKQINKDLFVSEVFQETFGPALQWQFPGNVTLKESNVLALPMAARLLVLAVVKGHSFSSLLLRTEEVGWEQGKLFIQVSAIFSLNQFSPDSSKQLFRFFELGKCWF